MQFGLFVGRLICKKSEQFTFIPSSKNVLLSENGNPISYNTQKGTGGGDKPHNNMPPFYVLCYICYIGNLII